MRRARRRNSDRKQLNHRNYSHGAPLILSIGRVDRHELRPQFPTTLGVDSLRPNVNSFVHHLHVGCVRSLEIQVPSRMPIRSGK